MNIALVIKDDNIQKALESDDLDNKTVEFVKEYIQTDGSLLVMFNSDSREVIVIRRNNRGTEGWGLWFACNEF